MPTEPDFYSLLGVSRQASNSEIRRAYRRAAKRLHPDKNVRPGDTELFLEISKAYEVLLDAEKRQAYDKDLKPDTSQVLYRPGYQCRVLRSRTSLMRLDEPQVYYLLIDVIPSGDADNLRPPINICILIDRSTSMRGERLDHVRSATVSILEGLSPHDSASIVAFGDRAELTVSVEEAKDITLARALLSKMQAGGGTEIAEGLAMAMNESRQWLSNKGLNHIILLTDGRTYGDEEVCYKMASEASEEGITINAVGIGSDWSDKFLDELARRTGGNVAILDSPHAARDLLERLLASLTDTLASHVRLKGTLNPAVDLREAFRLTPDPMPLRDSFPINLGSLPSRKELRVLLDLIIHPLGRRKAIQLGSWEIDAEFLGNVVQPSPLTLEPSAEVTDTPDLDPPPHEILAAIDALTLYRLQEKVRNDVELGRTRSAASRLQSLATRLLESGERHLARTAQEEAERLIRTSRMSPAAEKALKYGTRALLLPPPASGNHD